MRHGLCLLIMTFACAMTSDERAMSIERGLDAGSAALDLAVDLQVEACRAKNLKTEDEREACVEEMVLANDVATPVVELAVSGLQTYWIARTAGNNEAAAHALHDVCEAVRGLPDKHFAGLKLLAKGC